LPKLQIFENCLTCILLAINVVPDPEGFLNANLINLGAMNVDGTGYKRPEGCPEIQTGTPCEHNYTMWEWLFTSKPGIWGLMGGWANPTGVAMIICLTVMFVCSLPVIRRSGHFEVLGFSFRCTKKKLSYP
jgi:hypothetical protein